MKAIKRLCLNVVFYASCILFSVVYMPPMAVYLALLALFVPHRTQMRALRASMRWYGLVIIRVLTFPLLRLQYRDKETDGTDGAKLYVCNHRSSSDPYLVACLPGECVQIVNIWPFRIPVLGAVARRAGYLSVNEMKVEDFYDRAKELLGEGVSIIAFPEGTRSASREMGPFYSSVFRFALQVHATIVPVCISGNEDKPAKGSLILQPGVVRVHKMPEIAWRTYKDKTSFQLKTMVRNTMQEELFAMDRED